MSTTLVTAATGHVGSEVVRQLARRGVPVRAFVRDPDKAEQVIGDTVGVDVAVGDLADRASVERAMTGVDRVFLACGNVAGQVGFETGVIDAAVAARVRRIVKLSSPEPAVDAPLVFDRWHGQVEQHLRSSGLQWTLLRPRTYLTNLLAHAPTVAQLGRIVAPAGASRITFVDPGDVGAAGAAAIAEDGHDGRTYVLTGPVAVTYDDVARAISAATGRDVQFVDVPDEAAQQAMLDAGLPPFLAEFVVGVHRIQRAGAMAAPTGDLRRLLGRDGRTVEAWARACAPAFAAVPAGAAS